MKTRRIRLLALGLAATALVSSAPLTAFAEEQDYTVESTVDAFDLIDDSSYIVDDADMDHQENYEEPVYVEEEAFEQHAEETSLNETLDSIGEAQDEETEAAGEAQEDDEEAAGEELNDEAADEEMQEDMTEDAGETVPDAEDGKDTLSEDLLTGDAEEDPVLGMAAQTGKDGENKANLEKNGELNYKKPEDHSNILSKTKVEDVPADNGKHDASKEFVDLGKTYVKNFFDTTVGMISKSWPEMEIVVSPLKGILGFVMDRGDLGTKIDKLSEQIKESAKEQKKYTTNAVTIGLYGTEFDHLKSSTDAMLEDIKNIYRSNRSEDEKTKRIADLYKDSDNLRTSLNNTTTILNGNSLANTGKVSLYQVVYDSAVSESMFSGEAIDRTAPYLYDAMNRFVKANAVMDIILTAKEKVEGKNTMLESRDLITSRFTGTFDKNGKSNNDSILQRYADYFNQDRCVFINKGKEKVAFDNTLRVFDASKNDEVNIAVGEMNKYSRLDPNKVPMNLDRTKAITDHLKGLKLDGGTMELTDYLDAVGFKFVSIKDKSPMTAANAKGGTKGTLFEYKK